MAQWIPLVEVSEDAQGYVIKAELPEVMKEDVKITLENGTLIITGQRKFDQNSKKDEPPALSYGRFAHSFVIPNNARPARVTTVFKNGVLIVHLTRNRRPQPSNSKAKLPRRALSESAAKCSTDLFASRPLVCLFPESQNINKNENKE